MLEQFVKLPIRKRVGILAIILGFIAIFAGSPYNRSTAQINVKEFALTSVTDESKVNANELADWIIKGKYDYRLVDLRDKEKYETYNIPVSENISVRNILDSDLMRNEKIVLYSDDEMVAAQTWFLLKADKFKSVYILKGGLKSWKDQVLFPTLESEPTQEHLALFAKKIEVSKFFGGQPQFGGNEEINKKTPKLKAPPKVEVTKKRKKKSREGC
ncbi:rhodanese-like domain-containing protein [Bacteroidota bacterium]